MKVNKNSFMYRYLTTDTFKLDVTLARRQFTICDLVSNIAKKVLSILTVAFLLVVSFYSLGDFAWALYLHELPEDPTGFLLLGLILWGSIISTLGVLVFIKVSIKISRLLGRKEVDKRKLSLIAEYLRAKKQKVCTIVTFEE